MDESSLFLWMMYSFSFFKIWFSMVSLPIICSSLTISFFNLLISWWLLFLLSVPSRYCLFQRLGYSPKLVLNEFRFPRLYRRGTVKTQAVLVLFLLLPGIGRICESLRRWFLQWRQNSLYPKFLFGPSRPCAGSWTFCLRDLLVFFLMVSITILTAYFGGITIYRWIWSGFIPISIYSQSG